MKNMINIKETIKGILIILSYFILPTIIYMPFYLLQERKIIGYQLAMILTYILICIFYCYLYRKCLKKDLIIFKDNYKVILKSSIKYWLIGLIIMIISSTLIDYFNIIPNTNQENNINTLKNYPMYEIICAVFIVPIIEEIIFRLSLKKGLKNKHLFAIFTGLTFAFMHILSSLNNLTSLIYLIPFGAVGISFGYAYYKTNNIYGTIITHSIHNAISLIQIFILLF